MDEMLKLFKQVQINLPILDAIKQLPSYAKFLKDLCTQKRKMRTQVPKKIMLTEHVNAVLTNQFPPKSKDHVLSLFHVSLETSLSQEHYWI